LSKDELDVEKLLGSRGRIRVLRVLTESRELNISEIGRRTGMNYTSVERHLEILKDMGILKEKRYGKIRIFETIFNKITINFEKSRGVRIEVDVS
jgi:DNA-binding transcriptional ArsR family regulator